MATIGAPSALFFPLLSLPSDLLILILEFIPLLDQPALAATNRHLHTILHPAVARHALQRFPYLLIWAAREGLADLVRTFLETGGDPNVYFVITSRTPSHSPRPPFPTGTRLVPVGFPWMGPWNPRVRRSRLATPSSLNHVFKHEDWIWEYRKQMEVFEAHHDDGNISSISSRLPRHLGEAKTRDTSLRFCTFSKAHIGQQQFSGNPLGIESFKKHSAGWCTALHLATFYGHGPVVELLILHGADIEALSFRVCGCRLHGMYEELNRRVPPPTYWTALHIALCQKEDVIALRLLSRGAGRGSTPGVLSTPALETAIRHGCIQAVRKLLGEVVERVGSDELRKLHPHLLCLAVESTGSVEVAQLLLSDGFNPNFTDRYGQTPFYIACQAQQLESAELLLEKTDNINWAPSPPQPGLRAIDWLCQKYATQNWPLTEPLMYSHPWAAKTVPRSPEVTLPLIAKMLEKRAEIGSKPKYHRSSLHNAAHGGNTELLDMLRAAGGDHELSAEGPDGDFPLLTAIGFDSHMPLGLQRSPENWSCLKWFLERGANPNQQRKHDGLSPLLAVCSRSLLMVPDKCSQEACRILLQAGADPNMYQSNGKGAFETALKLYRTKTCREIMAHGLNRSYSPSEMYELFKSLLSAVRSHHQALAGGVYPALRRDVSSTVERLRDHGSLLLDLVTDSNFFALYHIFWETTLWPSYRLSLAFLTKISLNPNYAPFDEPNTTCLHNVLNSTTSRLVYSYELELIDALIAKGVDVNKGAPILCAFSNQKWTAATRLLEAGAKIPIEKGEEILWTLISVSWAASIEILFRMVMMNLGLYQPRYNKYNQFGASASSAAPCDTQLRQERIDQLLVRACKVPRPEILRTILNAGANVNFMGATDVTGRGKIKTPLRALIRSAQPREDEWQAPCNDHVIAERMFGSFRLLCESGAMLSMPEKRPRPQRFRSQRRYRDLSLVEKTAESWPYSYFRDIVLERCEFFLASDDEHPRGITVVFRDEVHKFMRVRRDFGARIRDRGTSIEVVHDSDGPSNGSDSGQSVDEEHEDGPGERNEVVHNAAHSESRRQTAQTADGINSGLVHSTSATDQDDASSISTEAWFDDFETRTSSDDEVSDSKSDCSDLSAYASSFGD